MSNTKSKKTKHEEVAEKPAATLLSSISYNDPADYVKFLENLTPEHAVIVLIASDNHSQTKGVYTLEESELISKAIRTLTSPNSQESQTS